MLLAKKYAEVAGKLCREKDYTDKNLAKHFKVTETTINNWKRRYLEFFESIKRGSFPIL
jgi:transposase